MRNTALIILTLIISGQLFAKSHTSDEELSSVGLEKAKAEEYLKTGKCIYAGLYDIGKSMSDKTYVHPIANCINDITVNVGGADESRGCTVFNFNMKTGKIKYAKFYSNGYNEPFPQAQKKLCAEGGLKELLNKMWGTDSVGKHFLKANNQYYVSVDENVQKLFDDLKLNKGKTTIDWKPQSGLGSELKSPDGKADTKSEQSGIFNKIKSLFK